MRLLRVLSWLLAFTFIGCAAESSLQTQTTADVTPTTQTTDTAPDNATANNSSAIPITRNSSGLSAGDSALLTSTNEHPASAENAEEIAQGPSAFQTVKTTNDLGGATVRPIVANNDAADESAAPLPTVGPQEQEEEEEEVPLCNEQFFDVPDAADYKLAVERIGCDGIVAGVSTNVYDGTRAATRSEMLGTVMKIKGVALDAYSPVFSDVPQTHIFARQIVTAKRLGIVSGYGDGTFGPDDRVLRTHATIMIAKTMGLTVTTCDETLYSDVKAADANAFCTFVTAVTKAGYFVGRQDGSFGINAYLTRPEMAIVLDKIKGKPDRWEVKLAQ